MRNPPGGLGGTDFGGACLTAKLPNHWRAASKTHRLLWSTV
jgi:hypothetical protein